MKMLKTLLAVTLLSLASPAIVAHSYAQEAILTEESPAPSENFAPRVDIVDEADVVPSDTAVVIPVGSLIDDVLTGLASLIAALVAAIVAWALRSLPAALSALLRTFQVEQLLERAVDYGINAVKGASRDKVLTIDVGHKVIAEALNYAVAQAPAWLVQWVGGYDAIERMILARLDLEDDADVKSIGVKPIYRVK